jgi:Icc-related predicted phosphoesterase
MIDAVAGDMEDPSSGIFNVHVPPRGVGLDRCPELDTSTDPPTPVRIAGEIVFADAGSTAVLGAIERYQPRLGLHGHVHESRAAARLGQTLCINPGSDYRDGVLRAALVTVTHKHVRHQFISG